jgi:filamentous hemagglutinin family protein
MSNSSPVRNSKTALFTKCSGATLATALSGLLSGLAMLSAGTQANAAALPSGGHVVSGAATISSPSASQTLISQSSGKAIINWNGFSIGQGGSVQFNNGSGATLNRVTGASISSIDGVLSATGSVYLINPNGVVIGKTGVVNTGGGFVASTLDLNNANFLAGGDLVFSGGSTASVVNLGKVGSLGGDVALIATTVRNDGSLTASQGTVGLASGSSVLIRDAATDDGKFLVQVGGGQTALTNTGAIEAASAELRANGGNIYALAGNTAGLITAKGVSAVDGRVWLTAGDAGTLKVEGALKAMKSNGDGGTVETSAGSVDFTGVKVDTTGVTGKTGTWLVDPYDLTVDATAAATINTNLATSNVTLQTTTSGTTGPGTPNASGVGDININAPISWSSANILSLLAYHNVNFNSVVTASGAGKVVISGGMNFGYQGSKFKGALQFTGTPNSGQALTINNVSQTLIYTMAQLDAVDAVDDTVIASTPVTQYGAGLAGNYALARPLDAAGITYLHPLIGTSTTNFTGHLYGLGNSIANLTINTVSSDPTNSAGLFGSLYQINESGYISDLILTHASITGADNVGVLAGKASYGDIRNVGVLSSVITGKGDNVGGVVGYGNHTALSNVNFSGSVTGVNYVGGVVGYLNSSTIDSSNASGLVNGATDVGGLAGYTYGGTVSNNTGFANARGSENIGGLIGYADSSAISDSAATGTVTAVYSGSIANSGNSAGGLIGYGGAANLTRNYASGAVTGSTNVGGLIGTYSATYTHAINYNYATGAVTGTTNVGGLVGITTGGTYTNLYASGLVTGSSNAGGLFGSNTSVSVAGGYWDTQTTGQAFQVGTGALSGMNGLTTAQFATAANFSGWTFTSTAGATGWVLVDANGTLNNASGAAGATRPMFAAEYSTNITTSHQLQLMAMNLAASYTLNNNVSAVDTTTTAGVWNTALGFAPIGAGATHFTGALDGNGYTISGLHINGTGNYVGLIGYNSGSISNLTLTGASVVGNAYATGIVAGWNQGFITNVSVAGTVSGGGDHMGGLTGVNAGSLSNDNSSVTLNTGTWSAGGLTGYNSGAINSSSFTGSATSSGQVAGGLVGYNAHGSVTNSYATGAVADTAQAAGGAIGWNEGGALTGDWSSATVSGGAAHSGGLAGVNNSGAISYAYATGSVTGAANDSGGLVGYNSGSVQQSYSTGAVNGSSTYKGGLVGYNPGTVSTSYWDTTTSGRTQAVGAGTASATGLVTAQFGSISNLSGLNFTTTPGATGWFVMDTDGSLNNAGGTSSATRPMLASQYSTTITNGYQLQLMAMNLAGNYALASNIDLSTYNNFISVGAGSAHFTGSLYGNGYTISGLTLNGTGNYVGLIGYNAGTITNLGLTNASVVGNAYATGVVAGWNQGTISGVNVSGSLSGGGDHMGGLTGVNAGTISNSSTTLTLGTGAWSGGGLSGYNSGTINGSISATTLNSSGQVAGGLVGFNAHGAISSSSNFGAVNSSGQSSGGAVGWIEGGAISTSSSAGTVGGTASHEGGFAGVNNGGTVTTSYAFGPVAAVGNDAGGFVGYNNGALVNDASTSAVNGSAAAEGGLVGWNTASGTINGSYATGRINNANASAHVGGLVGANSGGVVADTYATGAVTGSGFSVGGLIGYNSGSLARSYASGAVTGAATNSGGLIGYNSGSISQSYFDYLTTGKSASVGAGSSSGVTSLATSVLQNGTLPTGFSSSVWSGGSGRYPLLILKLY